MLALNMLGLAIGAATINPISEIDPVEPSLGTGAVIWFAATNLIALFLGAYVAGHMSGMVDQGDGILHGLVTWAIVTLISVVMLTTSISNVVSGMVNAASQALSQAGQVVADVSPEVADALNIQDSTLAGIRNETRMLLQQAAVPATQPGNPDSEVANPPALNADQPATLTELQVNRAVQDLFNLDTIQDSDRDTVATLLADNSNLTEAQARATIDRWEQAYIEIRNDAEETVRRVTQQIADAVTLLAGAVFAAIIVGAFAAGVGGAVAVPDPESDVAEIVEAA
jgi:hypothetical protein